MAVVLAAFFVSPAHAVHFRWASQADASTMDPHVTMGLFNIGIALQVYEPLVVRNREDFAQFAPALAVSWSNPAPTKWIFKLREGVKFHDGTPFTADDVVFSFNRAGQLGSIFRIYATQAGVVRKIDDYSVEFTTPVRNPVILESVYFIPIMSRTWCEKHGVVKPQDFAHNEDTYAARHATGTGPYRLVAWEPGVKLLHEKNPAWWGIAEGRFTGNVDTIEYRPITNPATRLAALKSGQVDFVLDPPAQDVPRLREDPELRLWDGRENRVVMLGFDEARDELLYSTVKGANPFKDTRVRRALYQAIDVEAIRTQVMRGLSIPTAIALPDSEGAGVPSSYDKRWPYDPAAAKRLLAEAGYPAGFGFTLSCTTDGTVINGDKICVAVAGMWAHIGLQVKLELLPRAQFSPRALRRELTAFLLSWGVSPEPIFTLRPVWHSPESQSGAGMQNLGNASSPQLDVLIDRIETEMDRETRQELVNRAVKLMQEEVLLIPLHVQFNPWVSRRNVEVVHRRNNILYPPWVRVN
jgi:peptide/nickel transport system substrate-binding protein